MWILPKQLHTSAFVPDMEALNLDSNESSQICAQSLFVRSKPSPARTWSQKWKRDSWSQHLYGRILKPSHGQSFVERWTSSLADIPANHSLPPESEQARTTQDISGLGSQTEFDFCNLNAASLRTSKDTSRWDSPQSSVIWKKWVTEQRGEYSQRAKLVRLTNVSGCLFWPTMTDNEAHNTACPSQFKRNSLPLTARVMVEMFGQADQANHSTNGSRQESLEQSQQNWQTFAHGTHNRGETPHRQVVRALVHGDKAKTQCLTVDQVFAEEIKGTNQRQESWATPNCRDWKGEPSAAMTTQKSLPRDVQGKLNPRWVETLMGLPIGWTMPSCSHPIADPASAVTMLSAGDAKNTTQTAHVLGQIAVTTDNRTDELRLLGNGVVPATAEKAFRTLMQKLHE